MGQLILNIIPSCLPKTLLTAPEHPSHVITTLNSKIYSKYKSNNFYYYDRQRPFQPLSTQLRQIDNYYC